MSKTVVGLFSTTAQAEQVKQQLIAEGYKSQHIAIHANNQADGYASSSATANDNHYTDIGSGGGTGIGEKISSFFRSLSGGDDEVHDHYATGVNAGGALLAVTVDDDEAAEVAAKLKQHGARDIEGGSLQPGSKAPASGKASNATEEISIPVIEEELVVGKREVNRGGVRVYSHVVEKPVEANVNVVGKTSRVVEEVHVGKQSSEYTEAIHDTVRKTEVEVEQIAGKTAKQDR